ncbi:hypothetical protein FACS18949_13690 [Clostridia bacterium]|nr:hypothetical protein FACS18949_13690 [Clostridia bacterium]
MNTRCNALTAAQFAKLREASGLDTLDPALLETALGNSLFTLSSDIDGEAAGMLRVVGDGALLSVICDVLVAPDYRNLGIGSALVRLALDLCAEKMPPGRWLTVMVTCAPERHDFYQRLGFMDSGDGAMRVFVKR